MTEGRPLGPAEWELWDVWMRAQRLLTRELDRSLQQDHGISKAEFSVLVTLHRAAGGRMRVSELADALAWDKGRVAHQLTRMEGRELVERTEGGASGRRTGIALTGKGRIVARDAIRGHGVNLRRHFFETLTPEQAAVIREWSRQLIDRVEAPGGSTPSAAELRGG